MYRLTNLARVAGLGALGALVTLAACNTDSKVLMPTYANGDIFRSYIAIGNSITAGYQSGGINDSTQRQSYAYLLARQMGTQFHYPSLALRGCTPPMSNGVTGALTGTGSTATTCDFRSAASVTDILNNVAVPGAKVADVTSAGSSTTSSVLTDLFLGGKSQVQRALDARPTFATIWIGNNDALQAALSGLVQAPTLQGSFVTSYEAMIKQLLDSEPTLKGVLIGVAKAPYLPSMVLGSYIASTATAKAQINALVGTTVLVDANCTGSTSLVNIVSLIAQMKLYVSSGGTSGHPPIISCSRTGTAYPSPIGNAYILEADEQTSINNAVNAYNTYIAAKADVIGFAYWDPNTLFSASRTSGAIPQFPVYTCNTGNTSCTAVSYGSLISLDAIHPSLGGHIAIANGIIPVINAKYGTSLALVQ